MYINSHDFDVFYYHYANNNNNNKYISRKVMVFLIAVHIENVTHPCPGKSCLLGKAGPTAAARELDFF